MYFSCDWFYRLSQGKAERWWRSRKLLLLVRVLTLICVSLLPLHLFPTPSLQFTSLHITHTSRNTHTHQDLGKPAAFPVQNRYCSLNIVFPQVVHLTVLAIDELSCFWGLDPNSGEQEAEVSSKTPLCYKGVLKHKWGMTATLGWTRRKESHQESSTQTWIYRPLKDGKHLPTAATQCWRKHKSNVLHDRNLSEGQQPRVRLHGCAPNSHIGQT